MPQSDNGDVLIPYGEMTASVSVIGVGSSSLTGTIRVTAFTDLPFTMNLFSHFTIDTSVVPAIYGYQIKGRLSILDRSDLVGRLQITPNGSMKLMVDLKQRPLRELVIYDAEDTYVYSAIPTLNFSTDKVMLAGYFADEYGIARSLIQFNLATLLARFDVVQAVLRLHQAQIFSPPFEVDLYQVATPWSEDAITWLNRPQPSEFIRTFTAQKLGFVDVDVTDTITAWQEGVDANNGFMLIAGDETRTDLVEFKTSESLLAYRPRLIISYADPNDVVSPGQDSLISTVNIKATNHLPTKLFVAFTESLQSTLQVGTNVDLNGRLSINRTHVNMSMTVFSTSNVPSTLNVNTLFDRSVVIKSKFYIPFIHLLTSRLGVTLSEDVLSKIDVWFSSALESTLGVSLFTDVASQAFVLYREDVPSRIAVSEYSGLVSQIQVTHCTDQPSHVYVRYYESLASRLEVPMREGFNDLSTNVYVKHHEDLVSQLLIMPFTDVAMRLHAKVFDEWPASMHVKERYDLPCLLEVPPIQAMQDQSSTVQVTESASVPSMLHIYPYLPSMIFVGYADASEVESTIQVLPPVVYDGAKDINGKLTIPIYTITNDSLRLKLEVPRYTRASDVVSHLLVHEVKSLTSRLYVKPYASVDSTISVWHTSLISSTVGIKSPYLPSRLVIPYNEVNDLRSRAQVVRRFISERPSHIEVFEHSNLLGFIHVTTPSDLNSIIRVHNMNELPAVIGVKEVNDLPGVLIVFSVSATPSTIAVTEHESMNAHLAVLEHNGLLGRIEVFEVNNLQCRILVGQNFAYGFIM